MAEFNDVMREWRRFCKSHDNCGECEFDGAGICGDTHMSDVPFASIERRIMAWAAEHPEPQFPTWGEWLEQMGIISKEYGETFIDIPYGTFDTLTLNAEKIQQPIPADIAQKLGIEQKEG